MSASTDRWKVGDIVRIRGWEDMQAQYGVKSSTGSIACNHRFTVGMRCLCGRRFRITERFLGSSTVHLRPLWTPESKAESDACNCIFSTDMIESAAPSRFATNSGKKNA